MPAKSVEFEDEAQLWNVRLSWEPERYVQLGIASHDNRTVVDKLLGEHAQDPEVRRVMDKLLGDGTLAAFTGLWGTLDRPAVNRLIRLLRTARDDVFGRDA